MLSRLPGIGPKSALRLALHLLRAAPEETERLAESLRDMRQNTRRCKNCNNISDNDLCRICESPRRDTGSLCIVAEAQDVLAIEKSSQYIGRYHVLGGLINPLEGISPSDLNTKSLPERIQKESIKEIIFALNASMEGETTVFYLARKLQDLPVRLTNLARGIPIGTELEYADEFSIARSISERTPYQFPQPQTKES